MATSLSAYWVKFFKAAGFSQEVSTKHAVVFSNNRIKPDMLPDLDKPSLKEMGITLMGDMIAILRYAKKVVEETTCERFLVDSEDTSSAPRISPKPVVKKVAKETANKTVSILPKTDSTKKIVKTLPAIKKIVTVKKPMLVSNTINAEYINQKKPTPVKRKLLSEEIRDNSNEDNWNVVEKKKAKGILNSEDNIEYTIAVPKGSGIKTQQNILKKSVEQKRTVFDRLGDSSVTSTTNLADTTPTFNITGIGKDIFKKSASVFNRLGDIDDKKDYTPITGILKNGASNNGSGILKNRIPTIRTSIITKNRAVPKATGTMHADHELHKKNSLSNTNRILKLGKKITSNNISPNKEKLAKPVVTSNRLASERLISIPAKARLGMTTSKQVTFNKLPTVTHVKRADVFSRLGV